MSTSPPSLVDKSESTADSATLDPSARSRYGTKMTRRKNYFAAACAKARTTLSEDRRIARAPTGCVLSRRRASLLPQPVGRAPRPTVDAGSWRCGAGTCEPSRVRRVLYPAKPGQMPL